MDSECSGRLDLLTAQPSNQLAARADDDMARSHVYRSIVLAR
jgi:hypothetical protein